MMIKTRLSYSCAAELRWDKLVKNGSVGADTVCVLYVCFISYCLVVLSLTSVPNQRERST